MSMKPKSTYAATLNLPKSPIDIHTQLQKMEPVWLQAWEAEGLYNKVSQPKFEGQPSFELHDGPPYANGKIHPGHMVNKILKDILLKAKRLGNYFAPFRPGWDCHGLPIELKVEKFPGAAKLSSQAFRQRCSEYADSQVELQKSQFKRLGVWADWDHAYETKSPGVQAKVLRVLANLYEKGLVVRGQLPIYWCNDCKSSLSDYEVEYHEVEALSVYVKFPILESPYLRAQNFEAPKITSSVLIWTTALWTLPANQAVAVHPALPYQMVAFEGPSGTEHMLLAQDRVQSVLELQGIKQFEVLFTCNGSDLYGTQLCHPFLPKEAPIILAEHVTSMSGTGLVHIAPAHGEEDFNLGRKYQLSSETPVGVDGCFEQEHPLLAGLSLEAAQPILTELLGRTQTLFATQPIQHSYPHCWRHRKPVIFRATPQWFIPLDKALPGQSITLREAALQAFKQVKCLPSWGISRMEYGLRTRPDWCISRQRLWGLPLPLRVDRVTGKADPNNPEHLRKAAQIIEQHGAEYWLQKGHSILPSDESIDPLEENFVLDVWMDSGCTHASTRDEPLSPQASDVVLEGSDQFRGWFMASLLTKVALDGGLPYRAVISHGFVVDAQGHKMSKSLGNTVSIESLIERYGAETLRAWVACTDYQSEIVLSDETLERVQGTQRKVRNVLRYLLANLQDFNFERDGLDWEALLGVDQWALFELRLRQKQIIESYESFQFQRAYQSIFHFCSVELSSSYLEVLKDRLYVEPLQSHARRSAQTVLFHTLQALVRWCLPVLTFTVQEIWPHVQALTPAASQEADLALTCWWNCAIPLLDDQPCFRLQRKDWDRLNELRQQVLLQLEHARASHRIKNSLDAHVVLTLFEPSSQHWIEPYLQELHYWLCVSKVSRRVDLNPFERPRSDLAIDLEIVKVEAKKCPRCWMRRVEAESPFELCTRCLNHPALRPEEGGQLLASAGERRWF